MTHRSMFITSFYFVTSLMSQKQSTIQLMAREGGVPGRREVGLAINNLMFQVSQLKQEAKYLVVETEGQ